MSGEKNITHRNIAKKRRTKSSESNVFVHLTNSHAYKNAHHGHTVESNTCEHFSMSKQFFFLYFIARRNVRTVLPSIIIQQNDRML